jgi:tRNA-splicing endonuclease subunit Sen34
LPSEATKRGSGGGSPRKYHDLLSQAFKGRADEPQFVGGFFSVNKVFDEGFGEFVRSNGWGEMASDELIPISVVGGRGLIYDLDIVKHLREKYHICGTLIGILPTVPQQNVFMGVPVELMPEDMEYLVKELKVACLVDDVDAHRAAAAGLTRNDIDKISYERDQNHQKQMEIYKENTWQKRKEALERRRQNGQLDEPPLDEDRETVLQSMSLNVKSAITFKIPSSTSLATYNPNRFTAGNSFLVVPPSRGAYHIYRELIGKGYYVSPGLRFGGQFLAYPGDPLRYHSHYIVIGYDWDQDFSVLDIVGGGRLGTSVKKCWVIGALDEDQSYHTYSVEWAGFG